MRKLIYLLAFLLFPSALFGSIASVGSFATDANTTSADPYVFTADSQLDAGNIGVCVVATDNDGDGTDTNDFGTVTDAAGNTWTVVGENEVDNGAAGGGAALLIAYTKATTNLTAGSNITVDLSAARTAKVASCWEFTVGTNTVSSVGTEQKEDVTSGSGLEVGALTIDGLASGQQHLWVRGWASERNSNDVTSYTGSFSNVTAQFTTGGGSAANMAVNAEFILATATTETSDPTTPSGTDRVSSMIALKEDGTGGGGGGPALRRVILSQ